ncbi:RND family transporter [Candidatus Riflebacteria bacterium]
MKAFEIDFGKWVVKNRWWFIIATLLLVFVTASGTRFLTINNDNRVFFSKKNPQLVALEALENTYTKNQNVLFILAPKNGEVFSRETLKAVEELTQASWKIPYSSRVDSVSNFQYSRADEDELIVEDLVLDADRLSNADLKRIKNIALAEPQLLNRNISAKSDVTSINVNILLPGKSLEEVPRVAAFARKLALDFRKKYPGIDFHITGGVMIDNAFGEASQDDMTTLIPGMYIVLLIITWISLRSIAGTIATLLVILLSMLTGMGLAGWFGISITAASINAPTIILTLAVADSIHILVTIFQQMGQGKSKEDAIAESLRSNLQPVFLTSITTAIGFLTMNFSDAPPFRDLGNMVAMGVMAAFVYSVLFLPSLVAILPLRVTGKADEGTSPACGWLADFVIRRRTFLFWGTHIVIVVLAMGIFRIDLNDNFIQYFGQKYQIRRASDFLEANLTGRDAIEYSLETGETGGINNPLYLSKVEAFANWYRKQPKVVHVSAITDTIKRLNKNMHGDDESFYKIPEHRDLAAQYLLLYQMSLPFGLDLNNQINVAKSATKMTVTLKDVSTTETRLLDERARQWLSKNAPEMYTYGSGISMIWAHISERNINSMLSAGVLALFLISGILIFALGSFKLGLLSLVPNLAPAFMAFGLWGFVVGEVGLGLSVIVSLTLGIVVDDTVHFLSKYQRARGEYNMNPENAIRYSFCTVGTAMWVTTMVLVAGFLVLTLSGYKMNSQMGQMTAITIIFALLLDFLFLPALLLLVDRKSSPVEKPEIIQSVPAFSKLSWKN